MAILKDSKRILLIFCIATSGIGMGLISIALYRIAGMGREVSHVRNDIQIVLAKLRSGEDGLIDEAGNEPIVRFSAIQDAEGMVQELGERPSAERLAEAIVEMDGWLIKPGEEERFKNFKLGQQTRLRLLVKAEVSAYQETALKASSSSEGARRHVEAGRVLAMYPMSDEPAVLEEARSLASRQAESVGRLEALRRQRYNRWATGQIEKSLNFYNANVSRFNPFNDNAVLIGSMVENLGEVDPACLEPAVLELYNYVIERTKGSISEKNKLELAKRLTDPSVRRKVLGDF
jgi:hypothetical protein